MNNGQQRYVTQVFQGAEGETTTATVEEEGGGSKSMSRTKRGEWVTESKAVDESRGDEEKEEDSGKIAPGDEIRGRQNLKSGEDFRDSTTGDEVEKDQQSFDDQMEEETSDGNVTKTLTKRTLEDKASVCYSFSSFGLTAFDRVVWQAEKSPEVGKMVEKQVEEIIIITILLLLLIIIIIVSIIITEKQVEETRSGEAEEGRGRRVARCHHHQHQHYHHQH